jgi:cytochrome P450
VVSVLIADSDANRLTAEELRRYVLLLLVAGFETTTKTLANATYWLWRFPDERRKLVDAPGLLAGAVEELLRYDGATPHMARTLTEDVELHGVRMRRGDKVLLLFASANRDERRWEDPERLDVTRDARGHLSFGYGIHLCLGAWLARLELHAALGGLLARFPGYEVVVEGLDRTHTANNRGYFRVPLVVSR